MTKRRFDSTLALVIYRYLASLSYETRIITLEKLQTQSWKVTYLNRDATG